MTIYAKKCIAPNCGKSIIWDIQQRCYLNTATGKKHLEECNWTNPMRHDSSRLTQADEIRLSIGSLQKSVAYLTSIVSNIDSKVDRLITS
jgi:hypothetical protein